MKKHILLATLAALAAGHVSAADMNKVLRVAFNVPETGFDPAKVSDSYSGAILENVFDPLVTYDYDARPAKVVPNTIAASPQSWVITISPDSLRLITLMSASCGALPKSPFAS